MFAGGLFFLRDRKNGGNFFRVPFDELACTLLLDVTVAVVVVCVCCLSDMYDSDISFGGICVFSLQLLLLFRNAGWSLVVYAGCGREVW